MHRFSSCRALIEQRRASDIHLRQVGHHRLEVEQALEATLSDLSLVWCVLCVPTWILDQIAENYQWCVRIVVAHADVRLCNRIHRADLRELGEHLEFRERRRKIERTG